MVSLDFGTRILPSRTYNVFGHVCGDSSTPTIRLTIQQARETENCVLGVPDLKRGSLMNAVQFRERTGMSITEFALSKGWDMNLLPFSKGGPAASAALAIFQLDPAGLVSFAGVIGKDAIGDRIIDYFKRYNMPTDSLVRISDVQTSHTLVINEDIEGDPEAHRTFIHDEGPNAVIGFDDIPESALDFIRSGRNIVMVGGNWLMPTLNPDGILKIMEIARGRGAITILNTVHDPSSKWDLGDNAQEFVDLLITDLDEASGIAGLKDEGDGTDLAERCLFALSEKIPLLKQGFPNIVITNGEKGALLYASNSVAGQDSSVFHFAEDKEMIQRITAPCSGYIRGLDVPKYGLGAGDCTAGAFAVAAGMMMSPVNAALFAMSAGGACILNVAGEIGGPVKQGGHWLHVNEILSKMIINQMAGVRTLLD